MTATTHLALDARISAFARAVRAELGDLSPNDIDDLLDGLEADLSDQAADRGDTFELPEPVAYAAELRSAAGLPEPGEREGQKVRLSSRVRKSGARLVAGIRANPLSASVLSFALALRPVWWIVRGWVLYAFVSAAIWSAGSVTGVPGRNVGDWAIFAAFLVLSVQWGRGRWQPARWVRGVHYVVSIVAVIALPILVWSNVGVLQDRFYSSGDDPSYMYEELSVPGLAFDGERLRNIFAYDADGNPIPEVQLFDQDGSPLTTVSSDERMLDFDGYFYCGGGPAPVPLVQPGRAPVWNVFPLRELSTGVNFDCGEPNVDEAVTPVFPFIQVPPAQTAATPMPTPSASIALEATPAPETTPAP